MTSIWWFLAFAFLGILTIVSVFIPMLFPFVLFLDFFFILNSIKVIYTYQRGAVFTFGKFTKILNPGLNFIIPLIQRCVIIDLRLYVSDVPQQSPITKDNVSITVDAVIYYRVMKENPENSINKVENFHYAINQLAQTTMRNVIGELTLDEILSNRDDVSKKIQKIVDKSSDPWSIKVEAVELKKIELPDSMKTVMAKAAAAERIKRAAIIKSEGEAQAAKIIGEAANLISSVDGGLNLRTLQSLGNIASDPSNEVVFFVPLDVIKPLEGYKK
jgi:regulator of protease activity HflC (stomatin/prohibitin superfamily)